MPGAEQIASIRALAETLTGGSLGEQGDGLVEMAAARALAYCARQDIPPEMEQAVARLAAFAPEGGVSSLTRGDVSVTYGEARLLAELNPWRRLCSVAGDGA